jgi:ribosomal protein S18 acetylase RimI-like enzyme
MDVCSELRAASVAERAEALRLLFQRQTPTEADRLVANALWLISDGQVDPDGLFVLADPSGLLGVLLCIALPGASALVWGPETICDEARREREDQLLSHGLVWLRSRGVKVAQALLPPHEHSEVATLERHGFRHITHLWYLRRPPARPLPSVPFVPRLQYEPFQQTDPDLFRQALLLSYVDTLDCPEVNGARTAEEILQGHRAQGLFDPQLWWLLRYEDRPIGVLLVIEQTDSTDWEVSYLGLVPEARRRGFGREAMLHVLQRADEAARGVGLSVDGRNHPAWELYRGLGFVPCERREICLAIWG